MRNHQIKESFDSNIDLTVYSNSRVKIERIENSNTFLVSSTLKFHPCERNNFLARFIGSCLKRDRINFTWSGPASSIYGAFKTNLPCQ